MKPILLFVFALACGTMARAEIFTPRVVGGRGGPVDRPARMIGDHRQAFAGSRYGTHFGGTRHGRDRNYFWGFRSDCRGPVALLSFGYDDYLSFGYGDYPYDGWYGWPRPVRYAGWYERPAYFEPAIRTVYRPADRSVTDVWSGQFGPMPASDGIRDARSPDQLRAIYGAQAEQLIRQY